MSLNFNLSSRPEGYYQALPEILKEIHHNVLPWWCVGAGIGVVTPTTIPVILWRTRTITGEWVDNVEKALKAQGMTLEGALHQLVGFRCNVATETNSQWLKRIFKTRPNVPNRYDEEADLKAALRAEKSA